MGSRATMYGCQKSHNPWLKCHENEEKIDNDNVFRNDHIIKTTQPISMIFVSFFSEDNVLSDEIKILFMETMYGSQKSHNPWLKCHENEEKIDNDNVFRNDHIIKTTQPISMILVSFFLEDNVLSDEIKILYIFAFQSNKNRAFCFFWDTRCRGKAPLSDSPTSTQPYILHFESGESSRNNPKLIFYNCKLYTLLCTICVHVLGGFMIMLHFEIVRLFWSWVVAPWVQEVLSRNRPRPNCHGN